MQVILSCCAVIARPSRYLTSRSFRLWGEILNHFCPPLAEVAQSAGGGNKLSPAGGGAGGGNLLFCLNYLTLKSIFFQHRT